MLIIATGSCEKCKTQFAPLDMIQTVIVQCDMCGTHAKLCRRCKAAGCACGGHFLDARQRFEREHPGESVMF
jgi:hypothetical protein